MDWIEQLLAHLQALGLGEVGVNLFRHKMPAPVESGLLVVTLMPIEVHPDARQYYSGTVQIIARARTVDGATQKANSVIDAIGDEIIDLETVKIVHLRPRHLPLPFPSSEGDLVEASVNFDIKFLTKNL